MKKEEIIAGQIYQAEYNSGGIYIFEANTQGGYRNYIYVEGKMFSTSTDENFDWTTTYTVSQATPQQIAHFHACKEATKWVAEFEVPKEEIINNYPIY